MAAFLVLLLLLITPAVHVVGQPGFLSIDCGVDDEFSGFTDRNTGIVYVSDGPYTDAGEKLKVSATYESWSRLYTTVRSFPTGVQNCYALPTEAGAKYLVRMAALYGNHDGKNLSSIEFDLRLGANYWDTVYVEDNDVYEAIFLAWATWAPVCLVNTGRGAPFLSYLELRQLPSTLYPFVTSSEALNKFRRRNMGGVYTRFPDDPYDREWFTNFSPQWSNLFATQRSIQQDRSYVVPQNVLQTAVTAIGNDTAISYTWSAASRKGYSFMVVLHFADFQSTQTRQFDINFDGNRKGLSVGNPYSPQYLASSSVYSHGWYRATDSNYNITLIATQASELPPMVNAIEIYSQLDLGGPMTLPKDFDAIMAIKLAYGVKKNWMGDPCFPTKYAWDGVKCSNTSDSTLRITALDLSNSFLQGTISENFTLLTALVNLDLSYNDLTGSIPESLSSLPSLQVLNLSGNDLSGESLCKNYSKTLVLRYDSAKCNAKPGPSKNKAIVVAISVAVPVLIGAVLLAYFFCREKRKLNVTAHDAEKDPKHKNDPGSSKSCRDHLPNTENSQFTYDDLVNFTNNFKQLIGQGGFGLVYYGHLEDTTEVAVKMRSESSSQGIDEFLAEVKSLTKVHHRNLVSLIGYCWEKDHVALVYEYMSQGSLFHHLRGKDGSAEILNWGTRVRIVLEAAQGLDYLHKGCSPPIIHRDVKSSNILLDKNLQAKIADLGLSRAYLHDGQTHISATAAGTTGYMDPEYYLTGRLTESSDVYSFGVVLLEVATGDPPLVPGHGHIVQRVRQKIASGVFSSVPDLRLGGAYDINSMWKVVDTAMMCTSDAGAQRPSMAVVVTQLKDSLALEEAREARETETESNAEAILGVDTSADSLFTDGPSER